MTAEKSRSATGARPLIETLFSLEGKSIVVTGAAGFFGRSFVQALLGAGGKVLMLSRSDAVHTQRQAYADEFGEDSVTAHQVDFYDGAALEKTLTELLAHENVDVLVNNAFDISSRTGFNTPDGKLEVSTFGQWQSSMESGVYWAARASQIVGEQMRRRKQGSIINISSMYGLVSPHPSLYEGTPFFNPPAYGVAKAGLLALTRYIASFWGADNVRCNALVAGAFSNTEDATSYNAVPKDDPFLKRLEQRTLLNRVGTPQDLLGLLVLLASDASSYITGQALVVDGGWTVT